MKLQFSPPSSWPSVASKDEFADILTRYLETVSGRRVSMLEFGQWNSGKVRVHAEFSAEKTSIY